MVAEARMVTPHVVWRPAGRSLEKMGDAVLQYSVGGKADGILEALYLEELIDLGRGEGGNGAEVAPEWLVPISSHGRIEDSLPAIGTVHVPKAQLAPFDVAKLVEPRLPDSGAMPR